MILFDINYKIFSREVCNMKKLQSLIILGLSSALVVSIEQPYRLYPKLTTEQVQERCHLNKNVNTIKNLDLANFATTEYLANISAKNAVEDLYKDIEKTSETIHFWQRCAGLGSRWFVKESLRAFSPRSIPELEADQKYIAKLQNHYGQSPQDDRSEANPNRFKPDQNRWNEVLKSYSNKNSQLISNIILIKNNQLTYHIDKELQAEQYLSDLRHENFRYKMQSLLTFGVILGAVGLAVKTAQKTK